MAAAAGGRLRRAAAGVCWAAAGAAAAVAYSDNRGWLVPWMQAACSSKPAALSEPPPAIMRFGYPSNDNIRYRNGYVLSYSTVHRTANWTCEHLTQQKLAVRAVTRHKFDFEEDTTVHPYFRSNAEDYRRSGFDRGHLVPAGDQTDVEANMKDTFWYSNMSPQVGKGFNRDSWARLESYCRHMTSIYKDTYVITGPLYLPRNSSDGKRYVSYQVIGGNDVSVPTHFFKAIAGERPDGSIEIQAFVMPNAVIPDSTPLSSFLVPLEVLEKQSGLLLFDRIPNKLQLVRRDSNNRLASYPFDNKPPGPRGNNGSN